MANVDSAEIRKLEACDPETGSKVILRSLHKVRKFKIWPTIDRLNRPMGGVKEVDAQGNPILSEEEKKLGITFLTVNDFVEVVDGFEIDLSDPYGRAIWDMIKYCPDIAENREAADRADHVEFYIHVAGVEEDKKVAVEKRRTKAKTYIFDDNPVELYKKAKVLGTNMLGHTVSEVQSFLLGIAQISPDKIIELYTEATMGLKLFLIEALEKNVITKASGVYTYLDSAGNTIRFGLTEESAIAYFQDTKNKVIYEALKAEVYPQYATKKTTK